MPKLTKTLSTSLLISTISICTAQAAPSAMMFDDFSYQTVAQAKNNGWVIRTQTGHPGIKGATWWQEGISFHPDMVNLDNQVMRLTSKTDGSAINTRQTQICHQRKFYEGTYAARVYFNDAPEYGPDGDGIIETFYTISPLEYPLAPRYSEMDFEYLANGGWGEINNALFATSWETFQLTPWTKVNKYDTVVNSLQGWNTLVLQVADNKLKYFVNGKQFAEHGSDVYPEVDMSVNFNLWFTPEQILQTPVMRQYSQDVDWVYFQEDQVLSPQTVINNVAQLRAKNIAQKDTVKATIAPEKSHCQL